MYVAACKEFYTDLTVSISKKKEVARSKVHGVNIELDGMILADILRIPGNNGICEYIKEKWEESTYCKPLEITRKFANDDLIANARRVKSSKMKPFQHLLHFIVMKNVVPIFGKRDTTSFMDLTYMEHLLTRRLVNLPRVMLRHMAYVISVPCHELPYADLLTRLKRKNGVWWLGNGMNRRRDYENEEVNNEEARDENEEAVPEGFDWEVVNEEAELQGEQIEKDAEVAESGSGDKFFDAVEEVDESSVDKVAPAQEVTAPAVQQAKKKPD
ncbi:hypothetical protein Dimus_010791 [Dionaea muscipula]